MASPSTNIDSLQAGENFLPIDSTKKRRASDATSSVTATYSTKSSGDFTASTGLNIWNRLLSTNDSVWESLNLVNNEDEDLFLYEESKKWRPTGLSVVCLSAWYEIRHFFKTVASHPHIWLTSLAVGGLVAGVGMWAISSECDAYVADKMQTAEFVARETATWFSNEFKRSLLPLYSLREAVVHSGYFDELPNQIGRFPALLKEENKEINGGLANFRNVDGICDDEDILEKWTELVETSTRENGLDDIIYSYKLLPRNVNCLDYNTKKSDKAMMGSGMDMSNSEHPYWKGVVEDLFINHWKGVHVFGPFMAGEMEVFCTHLAIWNLYAKNKLDWTTYDGKFSLENVQNSYTNIAGTEVEDVWGFTYSMLDWSELKRRSNIYERFANVQMDFELNVKKMDFDPSTGPGGDRTNAYTLLAHSDNSDLLNDSNSIRVETESLHGIWENRVGITSENGWNPEWWGAAVASVAVAAVLLSLLTASTLVKSQLHRSLTEKMLPPKAIKALHRDQTLVERYNLVSLAYFDLVGFSNASSDMTPVQIMKMLNDLYSELDKIAKRHGVYKVETVGNRYVVCAGAPRQESARVAAKRVALFAIDAMSFVDNIFITAQGDKVHLRAGLASGPAVAGVVGKSMPHWTLFGNTVDLASRLEKTSKKTKIQCSEVTYRLLLDAPKMKFVLTKRTDNCGADGKKRGAEITYWVENASPCADCFELKKGSWTLDPCGHVLCAECNKAHEARVCPTCRCKVDSRTMWEGESPHKVLDISNASFDMMEEGESGESEREADQ